MPAPRPYAHLDGSVLPLAEARISPLDRGFLYGDAVYEVIPVYGGRPFLLHEHLVRLARSLREIAVPDPHDAAGWQAMIETLIEANGGGDQYVYLQVSRGAEWGRNHAAPVGLRPTVFAFSADLPAEEPPDSAPGVSAITAPDCRWARCDIKSTNLLGNVLAKTDANRVGATETIFLAGDELREGSSSAIVVVHGDTLCAPPESKAILPSTSRQLLLALAPDAGLAVRVGRVSAADLRAADEVFMCNATRAFLPIVSIDGRAVGQGRPGPWFHALRRRFDAYRRQVASRPALEPLS